MSVLDSPGIATWKRGVGSSGFTRFTLGLHAVLVLSELQLLLYNRLIQPLLHGQAPVNWPEPF